MSEQSVLLKEYEGIAIVDNRKDVDYSEFLSRITLFSKHSPKELGAKTVIFSENRLGWIYALFAVWNNRGIAVPVDAMVTLAEFVYIVKDCSPSAIWTNSKKLGFVSKALLEAELNIPVLLMEDYELSEIDSPYKSYVPYEDDSTSLIIYTSGTTGAPKGVMLSFRNILSNVYSVSRDVPIFRSELRTLILLPLHHVLPLMGSVVAPLMVGGGVAISPSMNSLDIMQTLQRGHVGIIIGVPRFWKMFYLGIKKKLDSSIITKTLFNLCKFLNNSSFSKLIFSSIRKKMGGRITYCVSGGAALDREIGVGLRVLGLDVLEGYGMSETAPMISFTRPDDIIPGCVGKPMPSVTVEIRQSEIYVKGPNVMQGYYNNPEATLSVIGEDGFLRTGDLGYFDDKGRLYITGRSKEIIVLSNGKNINPVEIEAEIDKFSACVKESAVLQENDILKAIIVPQPEMLDKSDAEIENLLKSEVLQPYNDSVPSYKRILSLLVYRGELPRTRLDKIQRFKLQSLQSEKEEKVQTVVEPTFPEYQMLKNYISREKNKQVLPTDHLDFDLAFDSLDKVSLQGFLEFTFGLEIDQNRLSSFQNVAELAEYIFDFKTYVGQEDIDWSNLVNQNVENLRLPSTWPTGIVLTKLFKLAVKNYFPLNVEGIENIPAEHPVIFAVNHQSYLDGMFVMSFLKPSIIRKTYFYAKREHVNNWFVKFFARKHNVIVVNSTNIKKSILQLSKVLKQGKNIIIFPEGTRSYDGSVAEFKKTFAILGKELKVPVVPVCISGAFDALPRGRKCPRRNPVTVSFLPIVNHDDSVSYETLASQVRQVIAEKLVVSNKS